MLEDALAICEGHKWLAALPATSPTIQSLFRAKSRAIAEFAIEALKRERPMTVRQTFYRAVSAGLLPNTDKRHYMTLVRILTTLRERRVIPLSWLVDNIRTTLKPSSWSGLSDFGAAAQRLYRMDFWASLPAHVEIFVEKDAIAGTLHPVTHEYDVSLRVCRGYSSVSFAGEIADLWRKVQKPIHAYYLGDFDPSGFDIERDLVSKLARYSGRSVAQGRAPLPSAFAWQRLGVVRDDFARHGLIALAVKDRDARAAKFRREHGSACAEIDALPPSELRERVRRAILSHVDGERWAALQRVEAAERETLETVLAKLPPRPAG